MTNQQATHFLGISQKQWMEAIGAACASFVAALLHEQRATIEKPRDEIAEAAALLGVPRNADFKQIRRAFRTKMLAHHPDRGGDADITQRLIAAKKVLLAKKIKRVA